MKANILLGLLLFWAALSPTAYSQELDKEEEDGRIWFMPGAPDLKKIREKIRNWDQSVLGFRKEHNFSFITGPMRGTWKAKKFNNQINKEFEDSAWLSKVRYSYHEQLYEGFGYYLGTSAGYWQVTRASDKMKLQSAAMLPGVLAGFALNITPGFRLLTGVEYYLERWNSLAEKDEIDNDSRVSITSRAFDMLVGFDIFFRLKWGVRFEAHRRKVEYVRPEDATDTAVDVVVERIDESFAMGLVYHLM